MHIFVNLIVTICLNVFLIFCFSPPFHNTVVNRMINYFMGLIHNQSMPVEVVQDRFLHFITVFCELLGYYSSLYLNFTKHF